MGTRGEMNAKSRAFVMQVRELLDEMESYWPLTLRQIYYQLVSAQIIDNNIHEYQKLSRLLTKARLEGVVPWEAMEDRSRSFEGNTGDQNENTFTEAWIGSFMRGFKRDCLQTQEVALEVWIEKDALSGIVNKVALKYCVPVVVARGFSSMSFKHECRKRVDENMVYDKKTIILYFGDFDPSGWEMLPAMLRTLQDEMELYDDVEGIRCALTREQVDLYNLPHSPDALKRTDSRAQKFVEQFGEIAVELDAIKPEYLEKMVENAIEDNIDMDLFEEQREIEEKEKLSITKARAKAIKAIRGTGGE